MKLFLKAWIVSSYLTDGFYHVYIYFMILFYENNFGAISKINNISNIIVGYDAKQQSEYVLYML